MVTDKYYQFGKSIIGFNHRIRNLPCQDAYECMLDDEPNLLVAAVADGHGSEPLSQFGSKIAARVACRCIAEFVKGFSESEIVRSLDSLTEDIFCGINPKVKNIALSDSKSYILDKNGYRKIININDLSNRTIEDSSILDDLSGYLIQLEKSIVFNWNNEISKVFKDLKENETDKLKELGVKESEKYSHYFGTTLLAAVLTDKYWFAIQIGDGTCVALFDENKENADFLKINQPIPEDERCYSNITTSLCDSDAYLDFRYCFGKTLPKAIFLGSDGIENSFPKETIQIDLKNFYVNLINEFSNANKEKRENILTDKLKYLTEEYSGDDVSIAGFISNSWLGLKQELADEAVVLSENKDDSQKINKIEVKSENVKKKHKKKKNPKSRFWTNYRKKRAKKKTKQQKIFMKL